jgi:hypothetical protein
LNESRSRLRLVAATEQEAIMRRLRFSIAGLLGVVLFLAVALAALRASTDAWDSGVLGLALLILLTAVLLTTHRTERRAFWLGFSLFGWAYLVASLIPTIGSRLPTTKALDFIDSKIPGRERTWVTGVLAYTTPFTSTAGTNPVQDFVLSPQGSTLASSSQGGVWLWDTTTGKLLAGPGGTTHNFICIGHSLLALVLAFIGGHLSSHLYHQGRGASLPSPDDPPTSR